MSSRGWSAALVFVAFLAGGSGMLAPRAASGQESASAGIPVTSDLVVRSCSRCHTQDADGRMTRISYLRKTP